MNIFVGFILVGILAYGILMIMGVHKVNEGYVGIYKRFGVLQPELTEPGIHGRIPFFHSFIEMKVSIQTDSVTNVPCGTSNGTLVYFDKIEVVNKLKKQYVYETVLNYTEDYQKFWITDKIHSQINQFCSKHSLQEIYIDIFDKLDQQLIRSLNKDLNVWAPGIQILSIRVTKPNIPQRIRQNFQLMEKTKVDFYIATQKKNVRVQQQMTKQKQAIIQTQSKLDVKIIEFKKKIQLKENQLNMAKIQAQIIYQKAKAQIDTQFLASFQQASLYPQLFTDKHLKYLVNDAFTSNATMIIGNKIPNIEVKQKI